MFEDQKRTTLNYQVRRFTRKDVNGLTALGLDFPLMALQLAPKGRTFAAASLSWDFFNGFQMKSLSSSWDNLLF